jgi:hypothetical protein
VAKLQVNIIRSHSDGIRRKHWLRQSCQRFDKR